MNTGASWPSLDEAESRVRGIQTKLHRWATGDPNRRFDDLYNLVCDPAFLVVAWERVRRNKGARSAGVDGVAPRAIAAGKEMFLNGVRADLKARRFSPLPVRERLIPKKGGKLRGLGIPTARDRTVQAVLKLVLEPILEADFRPCSYGFRPGRRAQDAIAEIHFFASRSYEWVFEGDITACFDEISHVGIMDRLRGRIADRRVLGLVKAFLTAGILTEDGATRDTITGTPQGAILSPLLSNLALSVLDEYFTEADGANGSTESARRRRCRQGLANYRLVRFADDFVVLVAGSRAHTEDVREKVAAALQPMGLRLSEQKTKIAHIDEGFDFLGFRIQRHQKRGTGACPLHVPVQGRPGGHSGERADADPAGYDEPNARRPAAPGQRGVAGLDQLLPLRGVQGDLQLPAGIGMAAGGQMATPQAPTGHMEVVAAALPVGVVANAG